MLRCQLRWRTVGLAVAIVACLSTQLSDAQGLRTGNLMPDRPSPKVAHFTLNITLAHGAPACGPMRAVILVNGLFQPTLYMNVNDTMRVTINNQLPTSLPQTASGISLHWHGFSMWDQAVWSDGTAYVAQCPLATGTSYTFSFLADEAPGTYFWHDHSTMNRANGLQGALVLNYPVTKEPIPRPEYQDGEHVVFISDWFNQEVNVMGMQLNRPLDTAKVTNDTGSFMRVGNADALLINGKGNTFDCDPDKINTTSMTTGRGVWAAPLCHVAALTVPPGGGSAGCTHETFVVEQGKNYRFRLINAGTQQFVTVCFGGHSVALLTADTTPIDQPVIDNGCVDLNTGQRYDVLFTADQKPDLYWISVHHQYATAAPSVYAVLKYAGVSSASGLPDSPTPQPTNVEPWDPDTLATITTSDFILGYNDNYDFESYWQLYMHRGLYAGGLLFPDLVPDKVVVFNMTQPLLGNGAMKWAINNVAHMNNPPCTALMDIMVNDPEYLNKHLAAQGEEQQQHDTAAMLQVETFNASSRPVVYDADKLQRGAPVRPVAGMHVVELAKDAVVDVIINNLPSSANNGDYRPNMTRPGSTQHPIHLHGHKFWVLGTGDGIYNASIHRDTLDFRAPIFRDTATLPAAGWLYIRFKASNPGLWPLHCHIMWHAYMGQMVFFAEAMSDVKKRPEKAPPCPKECVSSMAPFTKSWVAEKYAKSRFPLPP